MAGRDRLRELLDAVLDEDNRTLADMAQDAYASPFHLARTVSRDAGEAPVAMRRRVMLERAAWRLRQGVAVTDVAWEAGYESVDGFSRAFTRAFGHPPSRFAAEDHWLPAPNGIHFHTPTSLWLDSTERVVNPLTEQLVRHDVDDTRHLLALVRDVDPDVLARRSQPGRVVLAWHGPEESVLDVLRHHVETLEAWLAAVEGGQPPARTADASVADLAARYETAAPRWLALVRDLDRRGAWDDRLVDALCDPPESFVVSSVVAHVLTYGAHRRQLVRHALRAAGVAVDEGDPITWLRARRSETEGAP